MHDRAYSKAFGSDLKMAQNSGKITLVEVVTRMFPCGNAWEHILKYMVTHSNTCLSMQRLHSK